MSSSVVEKNSEIPLLDILIFLKRSYKLIALIGVFGVAASLIYLLIIPKKYQASAQIQMAQIGTTNNGKNSYPAGINIEEPALLIARLSSPTSYSAEISKACGLDSAKDAQVILSKLVRLTIPKGLDNVVDLRIIGASPEASFICAQSVFNMIKITQAKIAEPYIERSKAQLLDAEERLFKANSFLRADKNELAMSDAYLSRRDEILFLFDKITVLQNLTFVDENRATKLVAPIYTSGDVIAPKKHKVLLTGLFGGLILGLMIAFGRQLLPSLKAQLENNASPK